MAPRSRSERDEGRGRATRVAYAHVAFDLDGTLVDSRRDLVAAVNHVLQAAGRPPLPPTTLYRYVGDGARVLLERAFGDASRARVDAGVATFLAYYAEHLLDTTRPYPGIRRLLATLRRHGVACSVLTNKPVVLSRTILEGLGLADGFVDVVGGDSFPVRKPDPTGLDHLRALTATPRAETLLVGDSAVDVRTARAGGVAVCGVAWGLVPAALETAAPDWTIARAEDLVPIVLGGRPRA